MFFFFSFLFKFDKYGFLARCPIGEELLAGNANKQFRMDSCRAVSVVEI